jgi:hypothetical protein
MLEKANRECTIDEELLMSMGQIANIIKCINSLNIVLDNAFI